ncbi:MAG: PAN domain-containing protein [Sphingomonadales bacterium]
MSSIVRRIAATAALAFAAVFMVCGAADADSMGQSENGFDRPGGDYHSYASGGLSQCSTSCGTIARCKAYTYVPSTGVCWLKETVPSRVASNCCTSGVKMMGAMEMGFDRPGSDIRPGFDVTTSSSCERSCRLDASCKAYTFVKPGIQGASAKCWLKHAKPARVANSCCVSGVRIFGQPPRRSPPATRID